MLLFCFFQPVWSTIFILNQSKPIALYYTYIRKDKSTTITIFTISNTFFLHSKSLFSLIHYNTTVLPTSTVFLPKKNIHTHFIYPSDPHPKHPIRSDPWRTPSGKNPVDDLASITNKSSHYSYKKELDEPIRIKTQICIDHRWAWCFDKIIKW